MVKINIIYTKIEQLSKVIDKQVLSEAFKDIIKMLYDIYIENNASFYFRNLKIPKKHGYRIINVQSDTLRHLQRILLETIRFLSPIGTLKLPEFVVGMEKDTSVPKAVKLITDSISNYENKDNLYITALDISSYFDSISSYDIVKSLIEILKIDSFTANAITAIALATQIDKFNKDYTVINSYIKAGFTMSPTISNIFGLVFIDNIIRSLLPEGSKYFRYVDNIYILSKVKINTSTFPDLCEKEIAKQNIKSVIKFNKEKTWQYTFKDIKRKGIKILGCSIFHVEPTVGIHYYKKVKYYIHNDLKYYGSITRQKTHGLLSYLKSVDIKKYNRVMQRYIPRQRKLIGIKRKFDIIEGLKS